MIVQADTHVHLHAHHDVENFFDAARTNFERFIPAKSFQGIVRVMCLTDVEGVHSYRRLLNHASIAINWQFDQETDHDFITARHRKGDTILLLPGRQIVSRENIELLSLGMRKSIPDRQYSIEDLTVMALDHGAYPVLPWGPGKWVGLRERIVEALLEKKRVTMGDNGNRLQITRLPRLLKRALSLGVPVLAGSDPLPVPGSEMRAGHYGSYWEAEAFDAKMLTLFKQFNGLLGRFGRCETLWPFVLNQGFMQCRKLKKRNLQLS